MAKKTLTLKRIWFKSTAGIKFAFRRLEADARKLPRIEVAATARIAKRSMRKGPKKPKTRFGNIKAYRSGKKKGQYYWQKGLYSRPGHPPHHYNKPKDLRSMDYMQIAMSSATRIKRSDFPRSLGAGKVHAWRCGPILLNKGFHSKPVPQLHEYGGSVRISRQNPTFQTRNPMIRLRRTGWIGPGGTTGVVGGTGSLHYPERPYMRPAGHKARWSGKAAKGGSMRWLYKLGRMRGYKI